MDMNLEPIFTVPEVAGYLKVSKAKIYYLIQQGKIPYIRIGRNVRIRRCDLEDWLDGLISKKGEHKRIGFL